MKYDFVMVATGKYHGIIADKHGNSYYMPKEFLQALPDGKYPEIGDFLHVVTTEKLQMTELSSTDMIICHGEVKIFLKGSLLEQGRTGKFLVSNVSYGSTLLTELHTGKDYLIFNSYVSEGCRTAGTDWHHVTEGNIVTFLLFDNMPVMPVPRKKYVFSRKAPTARSFWHRVSNYTGAFSGASSNSELSAFSSVTAISADSSGVVSDGAVSDSAVSDSVVSGSVVSAT